MSKRHMLWTEHMPRGIPEMDKQHKWFRALLDQVYRGLLSRECCPKIECVVFDLEECAKAHFDEEEGLMELYGYPGLQGHMDSHAEFTGKLAEIGQRVVAGETVGLELLHFLGDWWSFHISMADRHYVDFIRTQEKAGLCGRSV